MMANNQAHEEDYTLNPLLEEGADGAIHRIICMMEYLSCMRLQEGTTSMNSNMIYGRWLIDEALLKALKQVDKEATEKWKAKHWRRQTHKTGSPEKSSPD